MSNWTASTISIVKRSVQIALFFRQPAPITTQSNWTSSPDILKEIWNQLAVGYFPTHVGLSEYRIAWSERTQKRVLGSCNLSKKRVLIARSLDRPELKWALEALIYHEMCHAVVGIKKGKDGRRNRIHGPEFYQMERRHPGVIELDRWIKSGGWQKATRSFSAHRAYRKRYVQTSKN